jgi:uncharacterized membrane protein SirB2
MIDYLPQVRMLHVSFAIASGVLFLVRGLPVLVGQPPFDRRRLRRLSYGIDTVLLGAAILLMVLLRAWPGTQPWVAVKLTLVLVYIVLGSLALKRGRTRAIRRAAFIAAVAIYLAIIAVARGHDPLAPLRFLGIG